MAIEHEEDRLRQLLRDDGWSLPAWPGAEARVRRTARRQRLHAASASVAAGALVAAAVVLPLRLLGTTPQRTPAGAGSRPAASHPANPTHSSTPEKSYTLPPVDAPGFPVVVYPPPRVQLALGTPFDCPLGSNVQPFSPASSAQAKVVMKNVGYSLSRDLQLTDRALWPTIIKKWDSGGTRHFFPGRPGPVEYAGPLVNFHPPRWPPNLNNTIESECGLWLRMSTWLIVAGPQGSPAAQSELLFIDRGGHVLLYYTQ